jgi:hypothetical protein
MINRSPAPTAPTGQPPNSRPLALGSLHFTIQPLEKRVTIDGGTYQKLQIG